MARTTITEAQRISALEQRVGVLESERPGRKPKPLLAIRQRGVCAIDPSRDSSTCPDASIYRYQSGCHGDACRLKQHQAYERRKGATGRAAVVTAPPPRKRAPRKTAAKPAPAPTKRVAKKAPAKPVAKTVTKRVSKKTAA